MHKKIIPCEQYISYSVSSSDESDEYDESYECDESDGDLDNADWEQIAKCLSRSLGNHFDYGSKKIVNLQINEKKFQLRVKGHKELKDSYQKKSILPWERLLKKAIPFLNKSDYKEGNTIKLTYKIRKCHISFIITANQNTFTSSPQDSNPFKPDIRMVVKESFMIIQEGKKEKIDNVVPVKYKFFYRFFKFFITFCKKKPKQNTEERKSFSDI
ncbi:hypothetical protein ACFLZV_00030 [Candidatus Margulisiibacteriota bacterium]